MISEVRLHLELYGYNVAATIRWSEVYCICAFCSLFKHLAILFNNSANPEACSGSVRGENYAGGFFFQWKPRIVMV